MPHNALRDGATTWHLTFTQLPDRPTVNVCFYGLKWVKGRPHLAHQEWVSILRADEVDGSGEALQTLKAAVLELLGR